MSNNLAKNTTYLTIAAIGQKVLAFVYFMIIARTVGVEWTGKYFFALSFTTIFSIFVDFGLNHVLIREIAKDRSKISKYLNNVFTTKIFLAVVSAIAAIIIINAMGYDQLTLTLVYIALVVMILDSFHLTFYGVFRGIKTLKYEAIGIFVSEMIIVGFGGFVLFTNPTLPLLIIALLLGSIFHIIYSLILLKTKLNILPKWELDKIFLKATFIIAIPFALAGVSNKVYSYIDSVLLSLLAGDIYVGWYSIAYKFTYAFQFIPMAFVAGLYPALSSCWKKDNENLMKTFDQAMRYMMIISVPIALGIFSLADKIVLTFYGVDYFESILPLQILVFVLIAIFLDFPIGSLLNACDRQAVKTGIMVATMIVNVILNLILIPQYQVVGAAIAGLISFWMMFFIGIYFSRKIIKYSLKNIIFDGLKTGFSAFVMAAFVFFLKDQIFFAWLIPAGALIYFGLLFIVRGWRKDDISIIRNKVFRTK